MKKCIAWVFLALMLVVSQALAEDILYTGTVSKDMTIRAKKSTSAQKLGSVAAGELINIVEFDDTWTKVDQNGVVGYVLSKNVEDLAAAAGYNDEADAQYIGVATRELTIRAEKSKSALKLHMLAEGETVYVTELGDRGLPWSSRVCAAMFWAAISGSSHRRTRASSCRRKISRSPNSSRYTARRQT